MKDHHSMIPMKQNKFHALIRSATNLTCEFVHDGLKVDALGLTTDDMLSYVHCVADSLCGMFGYDPIYKVENKLLFMVKIGMDEKDNMFEDTVTEYGTSTVHEEEFAVDRTMDF